MLVGQALADVVVKRRAAARRLPASRAPRPNRASPQQSLKLSTPAVAYPRACGRHIGLFRRERGTCVTRASHEVDGIENHVGEQAQRR
jgi:hypothetical protein